MNIARFEVREWIDPWRDRRPMTDDVVLVTLWRRERISVEQAWYGGNVIDGTGRKDWHCVEGTVLAWMPLPEPYNPVEEEEVE